MQSVDKMIDAVVLILILVLAALPVISEAVSEGNFSGSVGLICGAFTVLLAVGGLVHIAKSMGGR
jgi:hypothetical protein